MPGKNKPAEYPGELFCDASFLIAYFASQDQDHSKALKVGKKLKGRPVRLYTSWPAISEAATLLLYHYGYSQACALLQALPAFTLITPSEGDYFQAVGLFKELNRDQKLSLNDLLASVFIRGNLRGIPVLTFDRDFSRMGLTVYRS